MTPFQQWRIERDAKIVALAKQGLSGKKIALEMPCSEPTVYSAIRRGWPERPVRGHPVSIVGAKWWAKNGRINRLISLWEEGVSARQIGRRLGCTRNAVIGKAHRLNLQARPSPIKRAA